MENNDYQNPVYMRCTFGPFNKAKFTWDGQLLHLSDVNARPRKITFLKMSREGFWEIRYMDHFEYIVVDRYLEICSREKNPQKLGMVMMNRMNNGEYDGCVFKAYFTGDPDDPQLQQPDNNFCMDENPGKFFWRKPEKCLCDADSAAPGASDNDGASPQGSGGSAQVAGSSSNAVASASAGDPLMSDAAGYLLALGAAAPAGSIAQVASSSPASPASAPAVQQGFPRQDLSGDPLCFYCPTNDKLTGVYQWDNEKQVFTRPTNKDGFRAQVHKIISLKTQRWVFSMIDCNGQVMPYSYMLRSFNDDPRNLKKSMLYERSVVDRTSCSTDHLKIGTVSSSVIPATCLWEKQDPSRVPPHLAAVSAVPPPVSRPAPTSMGTIYITCPTDPNISGRLDLSQVDGTYRRGVIGQNWACVMQHNAQNWGIRVFHPSGQELDLSYLVCTIGGNPGLFGKATLNVYIKHKNANQSILAWFSTVEFPLGINNNPLWFIPPSKTCNPARPTASGSSVRPTCAQVTLSGLPAPVQVESGGPSGSVQVESGGPSGSVQVESGGPSGSVQVESGGPSGSVQVESGGPSAPVQVESGGPSASASGLCVALNFQAAVAKVARLSKQSAELLVKAKQSDAEAVRMRTVMQGLDTRWKASIEVKKQAHGKLAQISERHRLALLEIESLGRDLEQAKSEFDNASNATGHLATSYRAEHTVYSDAVSVFESDRINFNAAREEARKARFEYNQADAQLTQLGRETQAPAPAAPEEATVISLHLAPSGRKRDRCDDGGDGGCGK